MFIPSFFKFPLGDTCVGLHLASVSIGDSTHVYNCLNCTSSWEGTMWLVPSLTVTPWWNGVILATPKYLAVMSTYMSFNVVQASV